MISYYRRVFIFASIFFCTVKADIERSVLFSKQWGSYSLFGCRKDANNF